MAFKEKIKRAEVLRSQVTTSAQMQGISYSLAIVLAELARASYLKGWEDAEQKKSRKK